MITTTSFRRRGRRGPPLRRSRRVPALVAGLAVLLGAAASAGAQTRGATLPVHWDADFATSGQSMWGPGEASLEEFSLQLVSESWSVGGSDKNIRTFFGEKFGADVSASTSGQFGFRLVFPGAGDATVGVSYPVRFQLDVPEPNSFAEGETVTIHTSRAMRSGATLTADPADLSMDFRGTLGMGFNVTGRFCAFGCSSNVFGPLFPVGGLLSDVSVFTLDDSPSFPGGVSVGALPHTFSSVETDLSGLKGTFGLPRPVSSSALAGDGSLSATGSAHYVDTTIDIDILMHRMGLPPLQKSVTLSKSGESGSLSYTVAGADLNLDMFLNQAFGFQPTLFTTLSFEAPVAWSVSDASGATVGSGTGTEVTLQVGHDLHVTFPGGRVTPISASPTFTLEGTLSNHTTHRATGSFDSEYGRFSFSIGKATWTDEVEKEVCDVWDPTGLLCLIVKTVTDLVDRASEAISFSEGPFATNSESLGDETTTVFQDSWQLGGFTPSAGPAITLDPENPIIAVETSLTPGLLAGTGAGTIAQGVTVTNDGDVTLSAVQVVDAVTAALTGAGFQVVSVTSADLTVSPGFDGAADPATLGGSDVLAVGGSASLSVVLAADPGDLYDVSVTAHGTSPIGTAVSDGAAATLGVYAMDIVPKKINRTSGDELPVKLLSSGGLVVSDVEPTSLRLEGAAPTDWEIGGGGAFLMARFPRPIVIAGLDERLGAGAAASIVAMASPEVDGSPAAPAAPARAVAMALLGAPSGLSDAQLTALDRAGNANGRLDLGDLRGRLLADAASTDAAADRPVASAKKGGGSTSAAAGSGSGHGNGHGTEQVFLLTGTLRDGTPFFAEATAEIIGG